MSRSTEVTDEAILELFRNHSDPVLTAGDVADEFGLSRQGANKRLNKLHEHGSVKRRKVGARAVVWWVPSAYDPAESQASCLPSSVGQ